MKDSVIAKLANQAADFYGDAFKQCHCKDSVPKVWTHTHTHRCRCRCRCVLLWFSDGVGRGFLPFCGGLLPCWGWRSASHPAQPTSTLTSSLRRGRKSEARKASKNCFGDFIYVTDVFPCANSQIRHCVAVLSTPAMQEWDLCETNCGNFNVLVAACAEKVLQSLTASSLFSLVSSPPLLL